MYAGSSSESQSGDKKEQWHLLTTTNVSSTQNQLHLFPYFKTHFTNFDLCPRELPIKDSMLLTIIITNN